MNPARWAALGTVCAMNLLTPYCFSLNFAGSSFVERITNVAASR